jgi:hypothetical protein
MCADDENRIRFDELGWELCHKIDHLLVTKVSQDWQGSPTMWEIGDLGFFISSTFCHQIFL